jgi:hypothetical protein
LRTQLYVGCVAGVAFVAAFAATSLLAQMPDPRMMAGRAVGSPELPDGTVMVRVVREQLANNLPGVGVDLHGAGAVRHATTGPDGRARFDGVPANARVHAVAVVDGERLESEPFDVPARGGMRTLLLAGAGQGTQGTGPATGGPPGAAPPVVAAEPATGLVLGANTRIVTEFAEDTLQLFYLLEIVNRTGRALSLAEPLVFDLPPGAAGTAVLQGATVEATVRGPRVSVAGPFPPGVTQLPVGCRFESVSGQLVIDQTFPLPLEQAVVAAQKVGNMRLASPQLVRQRETTIEGRAYIMAAGGGVPVGRPLRIELDGLPHHSRLPAYAALAIVGALVLLAGWLSRRGPSPDRRRRELEAKKARGLKALAALERERARGAINDAQYDTRRASLVAELEWIYGELDTAGGPPPTGDRGLAA